MTNTQPTPAREVEYVSTLDLNPGDVVRTHGMLLRLEAPESYVMNGREVRAFRGALLNPADIRHDAWLWHHTDNGRAWRIQGNRLATWARVLDTAGVTS